MTITRMPVRLRAYLRDSGNQPLVGGWIQITADTTIPDYYTQPKILITKKPARFYVTDSDGLVEIDLVNSADFGTTYLFEIGYTETVIVPPIPPSTQSTQVDKDIITDSFHAQIPRPIQSQSGNIPVDLADLIPTGIQMNTLDSSIQRLAEVIVSNPILRAQAVRPLTIKGIYQPSLSYVYGDVVTLSTNPIQTWVCISPSYTNPAPLPLDSNLWLRLL